ncbi:cob(I)yrinic acid a c-diamide adenosyltransferase [Caloranaerobacter azorensis H53214]|uniref:Cob(I)yrinic acid a c-diamide adenosyltransferase n=1 Tax=Caloranaerobacter azorensis H53214 TaxID=1156417 RepID=A0A096BGT0_9FIRM|nr:cob(I)yrinic acid a,c-diamide adenosyltransferase [Caloranaerobacter azorensis]KGG79963.1 cob(I)yrinic acid a c-diamide adenosyltransferase [Caloranaerobacter azorensis H53214]
MDKGLIQVYTGDGKGKTTAALGLGLRAVGYGYKVKMVQFLKGRDSGELFSTKKFNGNFEIYRFDKSKKFFWNMNEAEKEELKKKISYAFDFIEETIRKNDCDILILDEVMGVISNKLVSIDRVLHILDMKPENMEIILTGRNVPEDILDRADLVSEMKMIKHPFEKGIPARKGIEY